MPDDKAHAFMPMTRALLTDWVGPFIKDPIEEEKPSHLAPAAIGIYFWIVPTIVLDMLFTPFLLLAWLTGQKDVRF